MHTGFSEIDRSTETPRVDTSGGITHEVPDGAPLRVLSISHAALRECSERDRYLPPASMSDINLTVLVPSKFENFGAKVIAEPPLSSLDVRIQPIRLRKVGSAKWYMHYYP